MKIVALICRILLGLMFVVFGANILHPFMPMQMPPAGSPPAQFMGLWFPAAGCITSDSFSFSVAFSF